VKGEVCLSPVSESEEAEFLAMAEAYFTELNPEFVALDDWRASYFPRIKTNPDTRLLWIQCGRRRAGFVLYGLEKHRFLPRKTGCVYEFYILHQFRRSGIGRQAGEAIVQLLRESSPSKIQLEVASGNASAAEFWRALGFRKVAERYVLNEARK
jgi:ribosomal protein S18 acetylase RimI-like enzyme